MATVDLSAIQSALPIFSFLLVFTVLFAVLAKYKILGEGKWVNLFVSFLVAIMFVSVTSATNFVLNVTPWFAVFIICILFLLAVSGFVGEVPKGLKSGIGVLFVIGLLVLFIISGYYSFSSEPFVTSFLAWVKKPRIYGVLLLLVMSAIVSWVLVKSGGKDKS